MRQPLKQLTTTITPVAAAAGTAGTAAAAAQTAGAAAMDEAGIKGIPATHFYRR